MQDSLTSHANLKSNVERACSDLRFSSDLDMIQALRLLSNARRVIVSSHASPDPDAYASSVGLAYGLKSIGKEVSCINYSGVIPQLSYLPLVNEVIVKDPLLEPDLIVITDCAKISGLGRELSSFSPEGVKVLNLDHHLGSNSRYGDVNIVSSDVSCASELIYVILRDLGVRFDSQLATLLLAGIYNDTLSLQKLVRSPETFQIVKELFSHGADLERFVDQMYRSNPITLAKFKGELLSQIETRCNGRYLPIVIDESKLPSLGLSELDLAPLKNLPLEVQGVVIGAFIRLDRNLCKVSLRSKGSVSAQRVSEKFNGAGHFNAAGLAWKGPVEELLPKLEAAILEELEICDDLG